jgi:hypothetical protein
VPLSGLFAARLLSVLVSLALSVVATYAYVKLVRGRVAVFAILLLTSPVLLFYAEEARSYVLSFFGGVFLGIMFLTSFTANDKQQCRLVGAILVGAFGGLLCSVHLVSVATAAFVLFSLAALAAWHRLWWISFFSLALVVLVIIPGAASTLMLTSGVQSGGARTAWIHRRHALEAVLWFPVFLGLPSLVLIAAIVFSRKLGSTLFADPKLRPAVYALGTALTFLLLAVAIALVKPVLVLRYLATCAGFMLPAATMIAEVAVANVSPRPARFAFAVVVAFFLADTVAAIALPVRGGNWRAPGRYVQSIPGCRNSIIPVLVGSVAPSDVKVFSFMFAWYAGNRDRFVPATEQNLDENATLPCPIRLWAVHQGDFSQASFDAVARTCRRQATDVLKFDGGYLLVAASDATAADRWTGARTSCSEQIDKMLAKTR